MSLSFGLDSFEQCGVSSFKLVGKLHIGIERLGINLESFSQFLRSRIVKEGNVLIQVRHDEFIT